MAGSYYFNYRGRYVHAVQRITHVCRDGRYAHSAVKFRCGNSGFLSTDRPAKIFATPPPHRPLCRFCFPPSTSEQSTDAPR